MDIEDLLPDEDATLAFPPPDEDATLAFPPPPADVCIEEVCCVACDFDIDELLAEADGA